MLGQSNSIKKCSVILRWLGRVIGTMVAGFWGLILVVSIFQGVEDIELESAILTALIVISIAIVTLAWFREKAGALALIVDGLAFMVFAFFSAGQRKGFAMLVSGGPFLLAGLLLWMSAVLSSRYSANASP